MNKRNILNPGGWPGGYQINSCSLLQLILTLHINKNLLLAGVKAACPYSIQQYTAITAAPLPCIRTDLRTYIQYIVGKTAKPLSVEGENKEVRGYSKKDLKRQPRFTFSKNSNYEQESQLEVQRQNITGCCLQKICPKRCVDNAQQCFAEKINAKNSNVHDSLKVMGSNPGYLLKSSLFYRATFCVKIELRKCMIKSN